MLKIFKKYEQSFRHHKWRENKWNRRPKPAASGG